MSRGPAAIGPKPVSRHTGSPASEARRVRSGSERLARGAARTHVDAGPRVAGFGPLSRWRRGHRSSPRCAACACAACSVACRLYVRVDDDFDVPSRADGVVSSRQARVARCSRWLNARRSVDVGCASIRSAFSRALTGADPDAQVPVRSTRRTELPDVECESSQRPWPRGVTATCDSPDRLSGTHRFAQRWRTPVAIAPGPSCSSDRIPAAGSSSSANPAAQGLACFGTKLL